ncbi:DUF6607 family protein [Steroidobacter sp.]|uniref:DUF6607 family protein n=1 Tax=Steroidobacter sp. TaxID=1978227 RepID=UPI001A60D3C0|nr:DUF6607 family protein [Steroidobacter sp.]MBL8266907.1 hypothetical protein [Steroidobacter sp.]
MLRAGWVAVVAAAWVVGAASADESAGKQQQTAAPARYTFSWPLEAGTPAPRGGTTKGAPVTLDLEPSQAWKELRADGLSPQERDRRAILAMAGTYRVTFDFLEVVPFTPLEKPTSPYQSWGTEKVYVDSDDGKNISLVHILEMRIVQKDGAISEPMVTKHWRQDWQYQPTHVVEYRGRDRWQRRKLSAAESKGAWVQSVYQVDESPRYASVGRWEHSASFSSWLSAETWRPLPRREWSVRDDYQVLVGNNRHTIAPTGWIQEENNLKTVLTATREVDSSHPYIAREYGVARYERIRDADFAQADSYFDKTQQFWDQVRDEWSQIFLQQGEVTLKGPVDKLGLFHPLFEQAETIVEQGAAASAQSATVIRNALKDMGALP